MLPEEDGISILKKLRSNPDTASIPIIMLTAKDSEYDGFYLVPNKKSMSPILCMAGIPFANKNRQISKTARILNPAARRKIISHNRSLKLFTAESLSFRG